MGARTGLRAAKAKKDYYHALECCEDILSENPWDASALLDMAGVFEHLGLMEIAVWSAEGAMERDPADPTVNRALAGLYEKAGQFLKAINCWERVRKAKPADQEADRKMKDLAASATINRGGYERADSFHQAVADKAKTQGILDERKGGAESAEMRAQQQTADVQQRIQDTPTEPSNYLQLSQTLRRQGKLDDASALLQQALQATGGHADLQDALSEIEMERARAELAIAKKRAAANPNDADAQKLVQDLTRTCADSELREYQRRSERNPLDLNLRTELGVRLAKAGLYDQAIVELQKARGCSERRVEILTCIGRSFQAKRNLRMAKKHYEDALAALNANDQDNFKELHYVLGRVAEEMGDKENAVQHYEELAGLDYSFRDVGQRLDTLSTRPDATQGTEE
jgi:tetratricopeptide (TPR) repeat protein